jgi:hypothetical protein
MEKTMYKKISELTDALHQTSQLLEKVHGPSPVLDHARMLLDRVVVGVALGENPTVLVAALRGVKEGMKAWDDACRAMTVEAVNGILGKAEAAGAYVSRASRKEA